MQKMINLHGLGTLAPGRIMPALLVVSGANRYLAWLYRHEPGQVGIAKNDDH